MEVHTDVYIGIQLYGGTYGGIYRYTGMYRYISVYSCAQASRTQLHAKLCKKKMNILLYILVHVVRYSCFFFSVAPASRAHAAAACKAVQVYRVRYSFFLFFFPGAPASRALAAAACKAVRVYVQARPRCAYIILYNCIYDMYIRSSKLCEYMYNHGPGVCILYNTYAYICVCYLCIGPLERRMLTYADVC
jgi:hypothetical protein